MRSIDKEQINKTNRKKEEVEAFTDIDSYNELMERPYTKALKAEVRKRLLSYRLQEKNILEVGAGISEFKGLLENKNFVVCSDLNFNLLNRNPLRRGLVVCDAEKLPFSDKSFDFVLIVGLLHHLQDQRACLKEVQRVLRKGGRVLICEPHRKSLNFFYYSLRLLFMRILGVNFVKWLIGCFSPEESQADVIAVYDTFADHSEIEMNTILTFRLPPLRLFRDWSLDVRISRILDRIPVIDRFGTTVFLEVRLIN